MSMTPFTHSDYGKGFAKGVTIRGVPVLNLYGGNVFWVDSGGVGGSGTFARPCLTINAAMDLCAHDNGDIIICKPGHLESIATAATDNITFDIRGVCLIGLGTGDNQAQITFDVAAGKISVEADDCTIMGMRLSASVTIVTVGIEIADGVDDTAIIGNRFDVVLTGTDEFLVSVRTNDASNRATIEDNYFDMGLGGAVSAISMTKDTDDTMIRRNRIRGDYSTACINGLTTLSTKLEISDNILINGESDNINTEPGIELVTGSTGVISDNKIFCNVATPAAAIVADTCFLSGNEYSETVNAESVDLGGTVGDLTDAAATGAVTTTDTLMAYQKQIVTMLGPTELDADSLGEILVGTAGVTTWPAAAAPGDTVSFAEAIRFISEYQSPRIVPKAFAAAGSSLTTGLSPVSAFTVTGHVKVRVYGVVGATPLASTLNNGTLAVGFAGTTAAFLGATTADGTNFVAGAVWIDTSPTLIGESFVAANLVWVLMSSGTIIVTVATNSMTAGVLTLYAEWEPVSVGATLVAA